MKKNIFAHLLLFFTGIVLSISLAGCFQKEKPTETDIDNQLVVVETQHAKLTSSQKYRYTFDIMADVPISGPKRLMDSLKVFLNKNIFQAFDAITRDDQNSSYLSEGKVFQEDLTNILPYYEAQFKPYAKKIDSYLSVKLFLLTQTASFITYGLEYYHCGASCGSELACFTFDKKDGHLVKDIISIKKLRNFVKKHPDCKPSHLEDNDWVLNDKRILNNAVALLKDRLLIVDMGYKHYQTVLIDYPEIKTALSKEAQKLLNSSDSNKEYYELKNWHLGTRIGSMTGKDGRQISLSERFFVDFEGDAGCYLLEQDYMLESDNVLTAHSQVNGSLKMEDIFPRGNDEYGSSIEPHWDEIFSSLPENHNFAFNPDNNTLYIPIPENFTMGHHPACDRYDVYQFNGEHFAYKGEDGGFWLHPSIRNFGRLCFTGEDETYLIRVDEMRLYDTRYDDQAAAERLDTHRYRYVAWKNPKTMMDEPDLVVNGGYMDQGSYFFENAGYKYVVYPDMGRLYVYHGDKVIFEQRLYDITSFSD